MNVSIMAPVLLFAYSIRSEMEDANAAALVGNPEPMDQSEDNSMPSAQQQEEAIKKKFGGLMPKKPPLISKDHERAYFDSADWALGKQGVAKPKGPLEALRPKLQPSLALNMRTIAPPIQRNPMLCVTLIFVDFSQHANSNSNAQGAPFTPRQKTRMERALALRI
ncbi:hypothetical protein EJB05_30223 [Eragrostis curvula]|uniref:cAMP-regulated phosphoprotein 19-related protein n=1 Tax=Eragrostis curvula TaxID=38414 RepID=A0A5J9UIG1_9POAL|nr:hypothetical protein EJB05_32840 [Eragrostis curvula]TVU23188.1 hypothetical protein EJB05_30223 [Eragrostis curvula]